MRSGQRTTDATAAADRVARPPARRQIYVADDDGDEETRRRDLVSAGRRCLFLHKYNYKNSNNIYTHTRRARRTNTIIINIIKIYYS